MTYSAEQTTTEDEAVIERIEQIIAEHVRPYIEMDGGTIDFIRYAEQVVYVRLAGACVSCPSSSVTLKGGVERNIRRRIPAVRSVELDRDSFDDVVDADQPVVIQMPSIA